MAFVLKLIIFIAASALGVYFIKNRELMVRTIGKSEYAERVMRGGSYMLWVLIGAVLIILGFLLLVGQLNFLF
jgi:hypothetical protein